jgi:uncharacterized SAM-binding protein YcdF (DUF218 family)
MFFLLSKILALCCEPLTYVSLLIVIALLGYRKPRVGKACLLLALLLLVIFGTDPLPDLLIRTLEKQYTPMTTPPHVEAVIVLSGPVDLRLSTLEHIELRDSAERILEGIQLVQKGYGDILIITGGSADLYDQTKHEAVFLRQMALDFGVPDHKILIEQTSRNTYENAVNTRALMEQHGITTSLLVTTASHMPRSMGCFRKIGLEPIPYPVDFRADPHPEYHLLTIIPNAGGFRKTSFALHEYIGILTYKLIGYM